MWNLLRYEYCIFKVSFEKFCCCLVKNKEFYMAPFGFQHSLIPSRHTLNQVLTHFSRYIIPFSLHSLPQLQHPTWWCLLLQMGRRRHIKEKMPSRLRKADQNTEKFPFLFHYYFLKIVTMYETEPAHS